MIPLEEALARFLFDRQAKTYTNDEAYLDEVWSKWEVREFWMAEAEAIIGFLMPAVGE